MKALKTLAAVAGYTLGIIALGILYVTVMASAGGGPR